MLWGFPGGSMVKDLLAKQETWVWSPGWEDPLEKEIATHSGTLAWKIPWTEEPDGLQLMGSQKSQTQVSVWLTATANSNEQVYISILWYLKHCIKAFLAKSFQSCPTLCDLMDYGPPGSSVHVIIQAIIQDLLPCHPLGDLPDPGVELKSPVFPALAGGFFTTITTREASIEELILSI